MERRFDSADELRTTSRATGDSDRNANVPGADSNMRRRVFISYSWQDKSTADQIEQHLSQYNLDVVRDVRELGYKGSIVNFMKQVRKSDYVLMLISDSFLKSENCMFEVLEFIKDENYRDRVLPLVQETASIFSTTGKLQYLAWWQGQYRALSEEKSRYDEIHTIPITERLKLIDGISREILEFLSTISGMHVKTYSESVHEQVITEVLSHIGLTPVRNRRYILDIRSPHLAIMNAGESVFTLSRAFDNSIEFEVLHRTRWGDQYGFLSATSIDAKVFSQHLQKCYPHMSVDDLDVFLEADAYLICCTERTAEGRLVVWWKPYQYGYTTFVPEAGIYSITEAREIVGRCDPGSQLALPLVLVQQKFGRGTVPSNEKFRAVVSENKEVVIEKLNPTKGAKP